MARRWQFSNDCTVGEIAPDYLMRTDAVVRNRALKQARNLMLKPGGGFTRRWGSRRIGPVLGKTRLEVLGYGSGAHLMCFNAGGFTYRDLDGTALEVVGGCPWTADNLFTMQIACEKDRIVIVSGDFYPTVISRPAGGSWSVAGFTFAEGDDGRVLQPYYRFLGPDISIGPNTYSGATIVTFSAAVLDASWVGKRIRYDGIEILLGALIDSTHINGTIVGKLYPTYDVTLGSTEGFIVGQTVSGKDSQVDGFVASVVSGTVLRVQLHDSYVPFTGTEILVGPNAFSTISAVTLQATPAATVVWDEQALGYPTVCCIHRTRLLLAGLTTAPNLLMASTIGDITNFDVGTGLDTDAIVEPIGSGSTLQITQFGSAEQLLIFTENGPYYVPEQVAAPLSPTNLEVLRIGPEVAGSTTPILVSEGMMFTEDGSGRLMIAKATGNVRKSWDISDLAELAFHLSGTPVEVETLPATSSTDRLAFVLRDDGAIAVMTYRRSAEYTGWGLWTRNETAGLWRSLAAADGKLFAIVERDGFFFLDVFDPDVYGDSVVTQAWNASYLPFASQDVSVWDGVTKLGVYATSAGGAVPDLTDEPPVVDVGYDFTVTAEIVPVLDSNYGTSRRLRICRAWFDLLDSLPFKAKGYTPGGFAAPTFGGYVPPFTGRLSCTFMGHAFDDTLTVVQDQGGPLDMRSITAEVVY